MGTDQRDARTNGPHENMARYSEIEKLKGQVQCLVQELSDGAIQFRSAAGRIDELEKERQVSRGLLILHCVASQNLGALQRCLKSWRENNLKSHLREAKTSLQQNTGLDGFILQACRAELAGYKARCEALESQVRTLPFDPDCGNTQKSACSWKMTPRTLRLYLADQVSNRGVFPMIIDTLHATRIEQQKVLGALAETADVRKGLEVALSEVEEAYHQGILRLPTVKSFARQVNDVQLGILETRSKATLQP